MHQLQIHQGQIHEGQMHQDEMHEGGTDRDGGHVLDHDRVTGVTGVTGWFEACVEHRGSADDGPCTECGWLVADHDAGLAVVVSVTRTTAPPLRKAS